MILRACIEGTDCEAGRQEGTAMKWNAEIACPKCKGTAALRINRSGFLQRRVLGLLGIYPWKCGACGAQFLWRRRGSRNRSSLLDTDRVDSTGKS